VTLATDVGLGNVGWQPHPEVWLLVAAVIGLGLYAARVIGPKVVHDASPIVTRHQAVAFWAGVAVLWLAADWPMHDVGERYLYSVHMFQHLLLTFAVAPLFLLATPTWLARLVVGGGWFGARALRVLCRPVVAGVVFNAVLVLTHWPTIVDLAVESGPAHFLIHLVVVASALLMWMPVCGPLPEYRLSAPGQMVYLFLMSIVPTVPAAWLTFANGVVYHVYDRPDRLFGISVTDDQQIAGLTMKLLGGMFLWTIIAILFFRWAAAEERQDAGAVRVKQSTVDGPDDDVLTWDQVQDELQHLGPGPSER
jgi:putative membrane protein